MPALMPVPRNSNSTVGTGSTRADAGAGGEDRSSGMHRSYMAVAHRQTSVAGGVRAIACGRAGPILPRPVLRERAGVRVREEFRIADFGLRIERGAPHGSVFQSAIRNPKSAIP